MPSYKTVFGDNVQIFFKWGHAIGGLWFLLMGGVPVVYLAIIMPDQLIQSTDFIQFYTEEVVHTEGEVISRHKRGVEGPRGKTRTIWQYGFTFSDDNGVQKGGYSYSSKLTLEKGERVEVVFVKKNPRIAKIKDTRLQQFTFLWIYVFWSIFPVLGSIFILISMKRTRRTVRILKDFQVVIGVKTPSSGAITHSAAKEKFTYEVGEEKFVGKFPSSAKANESHSDYILFERNNPRNALRLQSLPQNLARRLAHLLKD
ncbi:MAG: hypothetical protein MRZ79_25825 [Bacteroidia bacterium]|nr:hypothetical protein [Bacteroidia bacterium]